MCLRRGRESHGHSEWFKHRAAMDLENRRTLWRAIQAPDSASVSPPPGSWPAIAGLQPHRMFVVGTRHCKVVGILGASPRTRMEYVRKPGRAFYGPFARL